MPREKGSLLKMLCGDEPGPIARILHNLSNGDEGSWGEECIAKLLKNRISDALFFRNVYVPVEDRTTELDIVMAAWNGIYIFESKAYGGKIYGHPDHMEWMQYIGRTKNSFYNPVKQNENHCRHLSKALQIPRGSVFSYIVFENRADLSNVPILTGSNFVVCNRGWLMEALSDTLSARAPAFSQEKYDFIRAKLEEWSNPENSVKERHIQQVQERIFGDICPVCGRNLTERKGKYGAFIGCAGYPQCKYTRAIKR